MFVGTVYCYMAVQKGTLWGIVECMICIIQCYSHVIDYNFGYCLHSYIMHLKHGWFQVKIMGTPENCSVYGMIKTYKKQ